MWLWWRPLDTAYLTISHLTFYSDFLSPTEQTNE